MERTSTFVFTFTDENVWKEFFTKYFQTKQEGMTADCVSTGDIVQKNDDFEAFVYNFFEEFNMMDLYCHLKAKNPRQEELLEKMENFLHS